MALIDSESASAILGISKDMLKQVTVAGLLKMEKNGDYDYEKINKLKAVLQKSLKMMQA